jgi:hypothetical protein
MWVLITLPFQVIGFVLAYAVGQAITGEIDSAITVARLKQSKRNQALYHGTWLPEDVALSSFMRDEFSGLRNHAEFIGADIPSFYKP